MLSKVRQKTSRYTRRQIMARVVLGGLAFSFAILLYVLAPIAVLSEPDMHVNPDLWIYYAITLGFPGALLGLIWGLTNLD